LEDHEDLRGFVLNRDGGCRTTMTGIFPQAQLNEFLSRYSPAVVRTAKGALATMRARLPGTTELVYDNYNALVIGFSPNDRPSDAIFSIALYPRWVTLFFLQNGPDLPDPERRLQGSGKIVRSIRLASASGLDDAAVRALMAEALARADPKIDAKRKRKLIIRSISAKRRPRR
jgi:hypothetical protein